MKLKSKSREVESRIEVQDKLEVEVQSSRTNSEVSEVFLKIRNEKLKSKSREVESRIEVQDKLEVEVQDKLKLRPQSSKQYQSSKINSEVFEVSLKVPNVKLKSKSREVESKIEVQDKLKDKEKINIALARKDKAHKPILSAASTVNLNPTFSAKSLQSVDPMPAVSMRESASFCTMTADDRDRIQTKVQVFYCDRCDRSTAREINPSISSLRHLPMTTPAPISVEGTEAATTNKSATEESLQSKDKMAENMTSDKLMNFMVNFKETMERSMGDITTKIDDKLTNLDKGIDDLTKEVRNNDKERKEQFNSLNDRLKKLEIDASRARHGRIKRNSGEISVENSRGPHDRKLPSDRPTGRPTDSPRPASRPSGRFTIDKDKDMDKEVEVTGEDMVRSNSWAEEVEEVIGDKWLQDKTSKEDKAQWLENKRQPSSWARNLSAQVEEEGSKIGTRTKTRQQTTKPASSSSSWMEAEHQCKGQKTYHHWFGESSSEEPSESSEEEGSNWNTVDREGRNKLRRKRTRERRERKTIEVAGKARRMVGLGPISDKAIESQMKKTKDYNQAKCWAVKEHLAANYDYNQAELDELKILETKCTNRDEIIYIAAETERDIKDIYLRKAECMNDKTIVKNYIPPHFFREVLGPE